MCIIHTYLHIRICEYNCIENDLEENRLRWLLLRKKAELEEEKGD